MDYLKLLERSWIAEQNSRGEDISRLEYLSREIFDFTTYDSAMDELFAEKACSVCCSITSGKTFDFISDAENYQWFLVMCNMPFFSGRLNWGTSIRGAWWEVCETEIRSCGLVDEIGNQILSLKFSCEEWNKFIEAIVEFSGVSTE